MSKNSETSAVPDTKTVEAPAMTTEQLLALVVSMQQQLTSLVSAQTANAQTQTEAILELARPKEPLKTKKQIAEELNEEQFKQQEKKQQTWAKANEKFAHDNCPHIAGCNRLSELKDMYERTSIIWHRGDVGQVTGICTVCQRFFKQNDPDFTKWRTMPCFNKDSAAGFRTVMDQAGAIENSYLHDID